MMIIMIIMMIMMIMTVTEIVTVIVVPVCVDVMRSFLMTSLISGLFISFTINKLMAFTNSSSLLNSNDNDDDNDDGDGKR